MIKGVSQKVIEVVQTDNRYFDKAILFLSPRAQEEDKTLLKARASEYLSQIRLRAHLPEPPKRKISKPVMIALALAICAVIVCAVLLL